MRKKYVFYVLFAIIIILQIGTIIFVGKEINMIRKEVKVGMDEYEKIQQADDVYGRVMDIVNPRLEQQDQSIANKFAEQDGRIDAQDQDIANKFQEQDSKIAATQDQTPKYVATSTTILGLSQDHGIALATDNNHWYYWSEGSRSYVDSGYEYRNTGQGLVVNNTTKGNGNDTIVQLHPENNPNDNLYPKVIGDSIENNSISYNKLSEELQTTLFDVEKGSLLEPVATLQNTKVIVNLTYNLIGIQANNNYYDVKIYQVEPNKIYWIYGYGSNDTTSPAAVMADRLNTDASVAIPQKGYILNDVSLANYNIKKVFDKSCYLYVNVRHGVQEMGLFDTELTLKKDETTIKDEANVSSYNVGFFKKENVYTFFKQYGDTYICMEYTNKFVNNLFQLNKIYEGSFSNNEILEISNFGISKSDVVGPISISRGTEDGWIGEWSGGSHGKRINSVEYPTARQKAIKIMCGGEEVTADGIYYGETIITCTNELFFPQTVTSSNLDTATLALTETRIYRYDILGRMNVDISLKGENTVRCNRYYGLQVLTFNMKNVLLPNNETIVNINPEAPHYFKEKEYDIKMIDSTNTYHYDVHLNDIGLGTFKHNNGDTNLYYGNVNVFSKIYYQLIAKNNVNILPNQVFNWSGYYHYYK